jgi:H+/Cl- antiporter ClcA
LWQARLVFSCGALTIGLISVGFAKLADLTQRSFESLTALNQWAFLMPLVVTPLGFALSSYLATRCFRTRKVAESLKRSRPQSEHDGRLESHER